MSIDTKGPRLVPHSVALAMIVAIALSVNHVHTAAVEYFPEGSRDKSAETEIQSLEVQPAAPVRYLSLRQETTDRAKSSTGSKVKKQKHVKTSTRKTSSSESDSGASWFDGDDSPEWWGLDEAGRLSGESPFFPYAKDHKKYTTKKPSK